MKNDTQIIRKNGAVILDAEDNICFHTIYGAINAVVGTEYKGWMKACWPSSEGSDNTNFRIWFPKLAERKDGKLVCASNDCLNTIADDWNEIVYDDLKQVDNADTPQYTGYDLIFAKEPSGGEYIFRGVFRFDAEQSHRYHHVEKRIATRVKLNGTPAHTAEILN